MRLVTWINRMLILFTQCTLYVRTAIRNSSEEKSRQLFLEDLIKRSKDHPRYQPQSGRSSPLATSAISNACPMDKSINYQDFPCTPSSSCQTPSTPTTTFPESSNKVLLAPCQDCLQGNFEQMCPADSLILVLRSQQCLPVSLRLGQPSNPPEHPHPINPSNPPEHPHPNNLLWMQEKVCQATIQMYASLQAMFKTRLYITTNHRTYPNALQLYKEHGDVAIQWYSPPLPDLNSQDNITEMNQSIPRCQEVRHSQEI